MPRVLSGKLIAFVLFLVALDLCAVPVLGLGLLQPVFVYLIVPYAAFEGAPGPRILGTAVLAGLARDLVTAQPFGIETSAAALAALGLAYAIHKLEHESLFMRLAITFLYVSSVSLLALGLMSFLETRAVSLRAVSLCFEGGISAAALMPFFSAAARRWLGMRAPLHQYELFS